MIERRYYVTILGFLLLISSGVFFILLDKKHAHALNATPINNDDMFVREFVDKFSYIKERLLAFKDIFSTFKKNVIPTYYDTVESIVFSTSFNDSIEFSFGYAGHGPLAQGFKGAQARIIIKDVPETWQNALRQALVDLNLAEIVNINPAQEWLLKFLLLAKDRVINKRIGFSEYIME